MEINIDALAQALRQSKLARESELGSKKNAERLLRIAIEHASVGFDLTEAVRVAATAKRAARQAKAAVRAAERFIIDQVLSAAEKAAESTPRGMLLGAAFAPRQVVRDLESIPEI